MITKLYVYERFFLTLEIELNIRRKKRKKEEIDNEAEYLGKNPSHPRDRFKRYNKMQDIKKKTKKILKIN